jgi:hypothetical protein
MRDDPQNMHAQEKSNKNPPHLSITALGRAHLLVLRVVRGCGAATCVAAARTHRSRRTQQNTAGFASRTHHTTTTTATATTSAGGPRAWTAGRHHQSGDGRQIGALHLRQRRSANTQPQSQCKRKKHHSMSAIEKRRRPTVEAHTNLGLRLDGLSAPLEVAAPAAAPEPGITTVGLELALGPAGEVEPV